jgi:hypothetical protein
VISPHTRVKLYINIGLNYYELCSLGFKNNEFFYHFSYPQTIKKRKVFNYVMQKETGRPDHISFHEDGYTHLRYKNDDTTKEHRFRMPDGCFIPENDQIITPLLIHSLYLIDGEFCLPIISQEEFYKEKGKNVLRNTGSFSTIIFLVPDNINNEQFVNCPLFTLNKKPICLSDLGFSLAGSLIVWPGWKINYAINYLALRADSSFTYFSAFSYTDLNKALQGFYLQTIDSTKLISV